MRRETVVPDFYHQGAPQTHWLRGYPWFLKVTKRT